MKKAVVHLYKIAVYIAQSRVHLLKFRMHLTELFLHILSHLSEPFCHQACEHLGVSLFFSRSFFHTDIILPSRSVGNLLGVHNAPS